MTSFELASVSPANDDIVCDANATMDKMIILFILFIR